MGKCVLRLVACAVVLAWMLAATPGPRRSEPQTQAAASTSGPSTGPATGRGVNFAGYRDLLAAEAMIEKSLSAPDAGTLGPAGMVAMLTRLHQAQSNTRQWQMLGGVGQRRWHDLALRVARRHPQAVRDAIGKGSPIKLELMHLLAQVGGRENALVLVREFRARPTLDNVIALGHVGAAETFPTLRAAMELDDPAISYLAAEALVRHGGPQVIPAIARRLRSADPKRRTSALRLAAQAGDKRLLKALSDVDGQVKRADRKELYRAVVSCGSDRYLEQVHKLALDERPYLAETQQRPPDPAELVIIWNYPQNRALDAIERLGSPDSLAILDRLASEAADPKIRKRAAAIASSIRDRTRKQAGG